MQKAEVVFDALHSLGTRKLPLRRVFRLLFNPSIYLEPGNQVPTPLLERLKTQRFRWGQNSAWDRLVHDAIVRILACYGSGHDGEFVHGLRSGTGIHSALKAARAIGQGAQWMGVWHFQELPNLTPSRIDGILDQRVKDRRFRDLIIHYVNCFPQPEVGPRNLFTQSLLPGDLHGICQHLALQDMDFHLASLAATTIGPRKAGREWIRSTLRFVRYMNWLLAAGNGTEEMARRWSTEFSALAQANSQGPGNSFAGLKEVSNLRSSRNFLGYDIAVSEKGKVSLRLPEKQAAEIRRPFQAYGKPASRGERTPLPDKVICDLYSQEFAAIDQFYALVENRRLLGKLQKVLRSSMLRTLAQKHKCRVSQVPKHACLQETDSNLMRKVEGTQFQVNWIDDVRWFDPKQTLVGEPCAMKVACTVRREAQRRS